MHRKYIININIYVVILSCFDQLRPCQHNIYDALHGRTTSEFVYFLDSTGKLLILQNFLLPSIKTNIGIFLSIYLIFFIYIFLQCSEGFTFFLLSSISTYLLVLHYIILYCTEANRFLLYKEYYAKKPICK